MWNLLIWLFIIGLFIKNPSPRMVAIMIVFGLIDITIMIFKRKNKKEKIISE